MSSRGSSVREWVFCARSFGSGTWNDSCVLEGRMERGYGCLGGFLAMTVQGGTGK